MPIRLSAFLNVRPSGLKRYGVFDALIGIDSRLFLDPLLLKTLRIPELRNSRKHFEDYFQKILFLLTKSRKRDGVAWREAKRRLIFKETKGVSLGYGISTGDGSGIGPALGNRLLETASEIVDLGITDPAIFELLGLLEEGFGPDRLCDMTISIIREDLYNYTSRVAAALELPRPVTVRTPSGRYRLPEGHTPREALVFIPARLLRRLPVAQSWDEIGDVVWFNERLRRRLNQLINAYWKQGVTNLKATLRANFLQHPAELKELLRGYNQYSGQPYDLASDPEGLLNWFELGQDFARDHPLVLNLTKQPKLDDMQRLVERIIGQFRDLIEHNSLNIHLFDAGGSPLHERYSQRLFYAVADSYCRANDIDLSPEPNAGSGPVDFKFSSGYDLRFLVEIKLSTNSQIARGYKKQLPTYEKAEKTKRSAYVIIRVAQSKGTIKTVQRLHAAANEKGRSAPGVFVIDGRRKPTASKR